MEKLLAMFLCHFLFFAEDALACKVVYPSEQRCESHFTVRVSLPRLYKLKKSLGVFYNQRDRFIESREKKIEFAQLQKLSRSSCFNLRYAEMHINFLLQVGERSTHFCKDHIMLLLDSVEKMTDFKSEENQFIKNHKHKTILIDQAMDVMSLAEAIKLEMEHL